VLGAPDSALPEQTDILERLGVGGRAAILRLRSLGDCVLATPAVQILQQARPDLRIAVIVEDRFAAVFENSGVEILPPRAKAIREFAPELCLNLHGGRRSARLTMLSGARFRAGFDIFRPGWLYNTPIPTAQETLGVNRRVHTAEHMASAIFYLGAPVTWVPRARIQAPPGRSSYGPAGSYAVIHPFAATPEKTWPSDSFLELAGYIEKSAGLEPVFIGAAADDFAPFRKWRCVEGAPLAGIIPLMRDAEFFAGNDSGPAHVAAAFGIPQVVMFGPSDAEVWAPWRTLGKVLKADGPIAGIPVERAIHAVERVRMVAAR
jgi:ADP-heptose:LPS heptosyltransferase